VKLFQNRLKISGHFNALAVGEAGGPALSGVAGAFAPSSTLRRLNVTARQTDSTWRHNEIAVR